jgi:hypothetical protein
VRFVFASRGNQWPIIIDTKNLLGSSRLAKVNECKRDTTSTIGMVSG